MEETYTFTSREIELLLFSIIEGIEATQRSFDICSRRGDMELIENERKNLNDLKSVYKHLVPHLSDEDLFI